MAEELPRGFGLSVVLIYLAGLGAVGYVGVHATRGRAEEQYQRHSRYALEQLAERLAVASVPPDRESGVAGSAPYLHILRDFTAHIPARNLRVLDARRRALASADAREINTVVADLGDAAWPPKITEVAEVNQVGWAAPHRLYRVPLRVAAAPVGVETSADSAVPARALYLEAVLPLEPPHPASLADYSGIMVLIMVASGSLFVVYRAVRGQLRGASAIAERLRLRGAGIEEDLVTLRVTDAEDAATRAWNQLIELTVELQEEVGRASANGELSRVLERTGGQGAAEVFNALPDGIVHLDAEGRVALANATACRLLGSNPENIRGLVLCREQTEQDAENSPQVTTVPGRRALEVIRAAFQQDGSIESVNQILEIPETDSCYRVWVIPLQDARHEGECVVVVRDVSQQVRAERAREEFMGQITHELRTPLTNIRAYAETLSSGMFDDPNVVTECYNVITKETRRLSRLVDDILNVSQIEVGTIELVEDAVDFKVLLSDGVRDVRGLADDKDIDLQLVLPTKFEPVRADRDKLAVVVNNLLGNAIKYTPKGGSVIVGCQFKSDEVVITVKDNGIGIAPEDQERVFEKFQRGNDPEVQEETGTGIGLYTAREIVRRHGGDITMMSSKGEGTTMVVSLPHEETRASARSVTQGA